jgi:hypothetical protein
MEDDCVGLGSLSDLEENDVNKNFILSSDSESEMDIEHKNISQKRMRVSSVVCVLRSLVIAVSQSSRGSLMVKALGYKPEGRGFETQWDEILNLPNHSGHTRLWSLLSL